MDFKKIIPLFTGTVITIPETAVADITVWISDLFTDLWVLIVLCIGLPLAFWAVSKIIAIVKGGFRTRR